jgi:hypothetical protein
MTDYDQWLATNDQFLSELMAWLRGRLEQLAGDHEAPGLARPGDDPRRPSQPAPHVRRRRWPAEPAPAIQPVPAVQPAAAPGPRPAPAALAEAENRDEPPPLILLARRLGLSDFERNVLLLAAAMELDTRIAPLCARAQHDPQRPYPTFALALTMFDRPSWDVMSSERPLRHWQLIDVDQARAEPLTVSRPEPPRRPARPHAQAHSTTRGCRSVTVSAEDRVGHRDRRAPIGGRRPALVHPAAGARRGQQAADRGRGCRRGRAGPGRAILG